MSIKYQLVFLMIFLSGGCGTPEEPGERESLSIHENVYRHHAIFHDDGQCLAMAPSENPEQFIIDYIDRELNATAVCVVRSLRRRVMG